MNSYWLIDANLKIYTTKDSDYKHTFGLEPSYNAIKPTNCISKAIGNFNESRTINSVADNKYTVSGIIHHSTGSTWTRIDKSMSYSSKVEYHDNGSISKIAQNIKIVTETETKNTNLKNETELNIQILEQSYPFRLFSNYTELDGKFDLYVEIDHGLDSNLQTRQGTSFITNQQQAKGNFGSLMPIFNKLNQKLKIQTEKSCYSRIVQAVNATIETDLETDCNLAIFR